MEIPMSYFEYKSPKFLILTFIILYMGVIFSCAQTKEIRKKPTLNFVSLTLSRKIDDSGVIAKSIDTTSIYSSEDKEVIALIQLENLSGTHNIRWDWHSPDGELYYSTGNAVAKTSDKNFIRDVTIWHRLSIAGEKAADLTGKWEVHVFMDDERVDIQYFNLMEPKYVIHLPDTVKSDFQYSKWALIVGLESYANLPDVMYARKDALTVKEYFGRVLGVPEGNIVTLLDQEATCQSLESYVTQYFPPNIQKNSILYVYFVGHGLPGTHDRNPYLMLYKGDSKSIENTGYSLEKFFRELKKLKNEMNYVFLDTSFSGYASRSTEWLLKETDTKKTEPNQLHLKSRKIISMQAAESSQPNKAYHAMQHGLFTYYFLRGIRGEADVNIDNKVSIIEVYNFLRHNVINGSKQMGIEQVPVILPALKKIKDRPFCITQIPNSK